MFLKFFEKYFSIKNIIFTIVFILFITFLFKSKNISLIFFASFVIACSINPFVDKLSNKMPRNTATLLVIVSIICAFFAVFIPICILCTQEIKSFIVAFPEYIDKFDDYLLSIPILNKLDFTADNLEMIATSMSNSSSEIMNSIFDIGKNIGTAFVYLIFSMMIIYYLVTDKKILKDFYLKSFPVQMRKKAETIGVLISKKTGGYLIAQLTTILSVGIVMLIGLSIMNINYALLLAILTAVFDICRGDYRHSDINRYRIRFIRIRTVICPLKLELLVRWIILMARNTCPINSIYNFYICTQMSGIL